MSAPLKREGLIKYFNDINVQKNQNFIKIHYSMNIDKIVKNKIFDLIYIVNRATLMLSHTDIIKLLDIFVGPTNEHEKTTLEETMIFKCLATNEEVQIVMIICRVDTSNTVIKLTQFDSNPDKYHYEHIMRALRHLAATKD